MPNPRKYSDPDPPRKYAVLEPPRAFSYPDLLPIHPTTIQHRNSSGLTTSTPELRVNTPSPTPSFPSSPQTHSEGGLWGHRVQNSGIWSEDVERRFRELDAKKTGGQTPIGLGYMPKTSPGGGSGKKKKHVRFLFSHKLASIRSC